MDETLSFKGSSLPPLDNIPPSTSPDRLVIQDTSLAMQVENVSTSVDAIESIATQNGGFMVHANVNSPGQKASGNITIRVPVEARNQVVENIKSLGIKIVSESVMGTDVTDQYEDISAKLQTLESTRDRFQEILDSATEVEDILEVQRELINIQSQIDSLNGRRQYLENSARLTLIAVSLSTDDLALPYTPDDEWRPMVTVKTAFRSLLTSLRSLGNTVIWLAVYGLIWIPVLIIAYLLYRRTH